MPKDETPHDVKLIGSIQEMQKNLPYTLRENLKAEGFDYLDETNVGSKTASSLVENKITLRIVLDVTLVFQMTDNVLDV